MSPFLRPDQPELPKASIFLSSRVTAGITACIGFGTRNRPNRSHRRPVRDEDRKPKHHRGNQAMKRTLITTALTISLVMTFDFSTLPAADLGLAALGDTTATIPAPSVETELISRGFRGGGGRRGGGFRGGARRSGGYRSAGARRSGGYRSGGYRNARSGSARRGTSTRSNSSHTQTRRASNSRSTNRGGRSGQANSRNRSGNRGGNRRGGNGGGWSAVWDAGSLVPVDVTPYVPYVVPVVPDVTPVVVDPQPAVIILLNPAETRTAVYYNLGGNQYSLEAGQSVGHGAETQVIAFDRGGSFGEARYTLAAGTYRFVATDHGWDLHTVTEEVASNTTDSTEQATTGTAQTNPLKLLNGG
jgi:hypothetical protein